MVPAKEQSCLRWLNGHRGIRGSSWSLAAAALHPLLRQPAPSSITIRPRCSGLLTAPKSKKLPLAAAQKEPRHEHHQPDHGRTLVAKKMRRQGKDVVRNKVEQDKTKREKSQNNQDIPHQPRMASPIKIFHPEIGPSRASKFNQNKVCPFTYISTKYALWTPFNR